MSGWSLDLGGPELWHAIQIEDEEMVQILLEEGANTEESHSTVTPLMLAAMKGLKRSVELLIEHGAVLMSENEGGWTPLMWAICSKNMEVVETLISAGAEVNQTTKNGTALMVSVHYGLEYTVKRLLDLGANPLLGNEKGCSIDVAMARGDLRMADKLRLAVALFESRSFESDSDKGSQTIRRRL